MALNDRELRRMAESLLGSLIEKGGSTLKGDRGAALECIEAAIRADLGRRDDLDKEARKLLEAHLKKAPPGVDQHRLLQMIKKKLAEERGIEL